MKTGRYILFILLFIVIIGGVLFFVVFKNKDAQREKDISELKRLEKAMLPDSLSIDHEKANQFIMACEAYANEYPQDSLVPNYLFKAGEISNGLKYSSKAITYFQRITDQYPDDVRAPMSLFFQAMIYEDHFHNIDKARELYSLFITRYPDHEFADDAAILIKNLGKSWDEILRDTVHQEKTDSTEVVKNPV